ncbi:MAG: exosortase-associated EpsI family protein [Verrucomicrobia bacterium]|nr:MAG: exosortase-associated EpsI family protein [Verrucomicrobiota bacterium]
MSSNEGTSLVNVRPFLTVIVLLALAALALTFTVDVNIADQAGIRMVLPAQLGAWQGTELRFCHNAACLKEFTVDQLTEPDKCPVCGAELHTMSLAEYEGLPKDTQFLKGRYTNAVGAEVFASLVLSGRERESIHRPERCLVGQGNSINKSYVLDVPLTGREPLGVMVLETSRPLDIHSGKRELPGYYAYWFAGQGRETPLHWERMFWLGWDRIIHSVSHKWAYIAIAGRRDAAAQFQEQIKSFVKQLYPELSLNGQAPPPAGTGS